MRIPMMDFVARCASVTGLMVVLACGASDGTAPHILAEGSITIDAAPAQILVGAAQQLSAIVRSPDGLVVHSKTVNWMSSNVATATVDMTGLVRGIALRSVTITASVDEKTATTPITVVAPATCSSSNVLPMEVGQVTTLSAAQRLQLCLGASAESVEYALVLVGATASGPVTVAAQNTIVTASASINNVFAASATPFADFRPSVAGADMDADITAMRGKRDYFAVSRPPPSTVATTLNLARLVAPPVEGSVVSLNANFSTYDCPGSPTLRSARVIKVLRNTVIYADQASPAGGYTDAELIAIGTAFDTLGFVVDTTNFGAPSDVDQNGRIGIFFTPAVNNAGLLGITLERDIFLSAPCPQSNHAEIFYLAVPDPGSVSYANTAGLLRAAPGAAAHEFQHLINLAYHEGRSFEVSFMQEGLSHIAEELYFYATSGLSPGTDFDQPRSDRAATAFAAFYANVVRYFAYLQSPESNSPFAPNSGNETRGAIWNFLRYAADRKSGDQRSTWRALVNTAATGINNLTSVFGNIDPILRDWAVAQFTDDNVAGVAANFTSPSWNTRGFSFSPGTPYPLAIRQLFGSPITVNLASDGASYFRFAIAPNQIATINGSSSGVATNVDFMLVRTK